VVAGRRVGEEQRERDDADRDEDDVEHCLTFENAARSESGEAALC
jgi:hypothetical protein